MLREPEYQPEDWEEPIEANTRKRAEQECRKRAQQYSKQGRTPVELTGVKRENNRSLNRFLCLFRS